MKLQQRISVAVRGLEQLMAFTGMTSDAKEWTFNTDQAPMGK